MRFFSISYCSRRILSFTDLWWSSSLFFNEMHAVVVPFWTKLQVVLVSSSIKLQAVEVSFFNEVVGSGSLFLIRFQAAVATCLAKLQAAIDSFFNNVGGCILVVPFLQKIQATVVSSLISLQAVAVTFLIKLQAAVISFLEKLQAVATFCTKVAVSSSPFFGKAAGCI